MAKSKPVSYTGNLAFRQFYTQNLTQGINKSQHGFIGYANFTLSVYGTAIPVNFIWSPEKSSVQQPFNQFGMSPSCKWITLHAGYRNLNYNTFTLGGHTIFGAGLDLTPGKLRLGMMYGRLARATTLDTLTQSLQAMQFDRKGFAAHVGWGSDINFIDFSILSARDNIRSLSNEHTNYLQKNLLIINPEANLAVGNVIRLVLGKSIVIENDAAVSAYTRDQQSKSFSALEEQTILKSINGYFPLNVSSEYYTAIQSAIGYQRKSTKIFIRYQRIDPDYKSMGTYFITNDIQNTTIQSSFALFEHKINVNGSLGFQSNNLNKLKATTANRVIGSFNSNMRFSKALNLNVNFTNFTTDQKPNVTRINDTLRVTQSTYNFNFAPFYTRINKNSVKTFFANYTESHLNDLNSSSVQTAAFNTAVFMIDFGHQSKISKSGYHIGVYHNKINSLNLVEQTYGPTLSIQGSAFKNKLSFNAQSSYQQGNRNKINQKIISANINTSFLIDRRQQLLALWYHQQRINNTMPTSFNRAEISYQLKF